MAIDFESEQATCDQTFLFLPRSFLVLDFGLLLHTSWSSKKNAARIGLDFLWQDVYMLLRRGRLAYINWLWE